MPFRADSMLTTTSRGFGIIEFPVRHNKDSDNISSSEVSNACLKISLLNIAGELTQSFQTYYQSILNSTFFTFLEL